MICTVLTYRADPVRELDIPVAALLLDPAGTLHFCRPEPHEVPREVQGLPWEPHIRVNFLKIQGWVARKSLPHSQGLGLDDPQQRAWWEHVEKLLRHSVRVQGISIIAPEADPRQAAQEVFCRRVLGMDV